MSELISSYVDQTRENKTLESSQSKQVLKIYKFLKTTIFDVI